MVPFSPRAYARLLAIATAGPLAATGCTGLAAGPEASAQTPVPVSRDSAWVRACRALTTEAFTVAGAGNSGRRPAVRAQ